GGPHDLHDRPPPEHARRLRREARDRGRQARPRRSGSAVAVGARRQIVVLGTLASSPYAGMAWMHMQIAAGLLRLGHDVHYFETTSAWPYDPVRELKVCDSDYAVPYLSAVAESFGLAGRWAYRRTYSDGEWLGMPAARAESLLRSADAVLNVAG